MKLQFIALEIELVLGLLVVQARHLGINTTLALGEFDIYKTLVTIRIFSFKRKLHVITAFII